MQQKAVNVIQDATAKAYAAQIQRVLSAMRVRGWRFPEQFNVAVQVTEASALRIVVEAKIDEVTSVDEIKVRTSSDDIPKAVDKLVAQWLKQHGTH